MLKAQAPLGRAEQRTLLPDIVHTSMLTFEVPGALRCSWNAFLPRMNFLSTVQMQ
jgi:hypothetical protein